MEQFECKPIVALNDTLRVISIKHKGDKANEETQEWFHGKEIYGMGN